ncbi:unnamed protein product [Symbiodinium sp. CCMP2592]|nr:unnamed protein product [Symbiodinium sp. CCMP2592]
MADAAPKEELFQWFASELAAERSNLETRHKQLLKELSSKLNAGKLRGPASALEALRFARTEDSDKRALDKPTPHDEPQKAMNFTAALPEEQPEEKHVFAANPEEAEMQKVVAAEAEMEEESKALHKKAKKERSELSNTLRRKSQKAEYLSEGFWYRIARHPLFELVFACCIMGHAATWSV